MAPQIAMPWLAMIGQILASLTGSQLGSVCSLCHVTSVFMVCIPSLGSNWPDFGQGLVTCLEPISHGCMQELSLSLVRF